MKITLSLLTVFLFSISNLVAQKYDVEWGEIAASKGRTYSILPVNGSDFFTLKNIGSRLLGSTVVAKYEDFKLKETGKLVPKVNGRSAILEGSQVIDGKFILFLSDKDNNENIFYMQEYGDNLEPKGRAIELAKYAMEKGKRKGAFSIHICEDKEFFAVEWVIPGKREVSDVIGYKVFDKELVEISSGEYEFPFDGDLTGFVHRYLSNSGDMFFAVSEYEPSERKGLFRGYEDYKALHLFHVTPSGLEKYTVDTKGRRIESLTLSSDNKGLFTIVGSYGDKDVSGISGVFNIRFDFFKKEIVQSGFEEFKKDFITQGWSDKEKNKAIKKQNKGKGAPKLYNYLMRQTEVLTDGSVVGSMEQYYVVESTTTDANGRTRTTYTYYYLDIVAFLINPNGEFEWVKKINKRQVSTNDRGPYSSYSRFVDGNSLNFIFNDNVKNYDDKGEFIDDADRLYAANFGKRKNVVALVSIDLESGATDRETFFDRAELDALAVPKNFSIDFINGEVLMHAIMRNKERFGLLKLENE